MLSIPSIRRPAASRWKTHVVGSLIGCGLGLLTAGAVLLTTPSASAKSTFESAYGYERTWNSALRLVRVDNGWKVTEKDEANGYLLFEYRSPEGGGKATSGSFELVRGKDNETPVRVVAQLPQMPRYHEQVLVDSLSSKMRQEYGDPPARIKRDKPPAAPDAGADGT